jgi:DNA invertase Pin-like site-specific DNA recombinase
MKKAYSYIRFSTKEQAEGDSLKRQTENTERYLMEHPELILDTKLNMFDSGLSAFKGKHISQGALGIFLNLVEAGKIESGSVLLIENIDRLTRLKPMEAFRYFDRIIHAGIKIVTLQSGMEYTEKSLNENHGQLYVIVGEIQRANQESERKSFLVGKAWETKRKLAINGDKRMTSKSPDWLKLSDDKKEFIINDEAKKVINLIFDLKLEGKGSERIAKDLNKSNLWKPPGRKGKIPSWRKSYIDKLLHDDKRLIGEHQLCKVIDGKRIPIGEPIFDYPAIIDQDKYNRVQAQIKRNAQNRGFSGGRNGKMCNLFSPLAVCSECGSPMQFIDKGKSPKGQQYFRCDKESRSIEGGCVSKMIRYDLVEKNILRFCKGLDVTDIMPNDQQQISELALLQNRKQAIDGELLELEKSIESFYDSISRITNVTLKRGLEHKASAEAIKQERLVQEKKEVISQIEKIGTAENNAQEQLKNIQELIDKMQNIGDQQRVEIRLNLRNHLRRLIKEIKIDTVENDIAMFFHTGERRLIILNTDGEPKILDAKPPKNMKK